MGDDAAGVLLDDAREDGPGGGGGGVGREDGALAFGPGVGDGCVDGGFDVGACERGVGWLVGSGLTRVGC